MRARHLYEIVPAASHRHTPPLLAIITACVIASATGCVRRTITITSTPPGALVWLNDREIGRTPVDVDFTYYGEYDVRLVRDGFEPLLTSGKANPPLWDNIPLDLAAELMPGTIHSGIAWHYELQPQVDDPEALRLRAEELRSQVQAEDAAEPPSDAAEPTDADGSNFGPPTTP